MKQLTRPGWLGAILFAGALTLSPGCRRDTHDTLTDVRQRGTLRWGGDEEGGGPYIFRRPGDPDQKLTGFEIDLLDLLARGLGAKSEFRSSNWPNLLNELSTHGIDVVANGYELTAERLRQYASTIPYYVYELHLFVRRGEPGVRDWADLRRARPAGGRWRIGVLKDTAALAYVAREFPQTVDVREYDGTTDAFREVENGAIDGTVTDTPAAVFYGRQFQVQEVGRPVDRGWYVMYVRANDTALRDALNHGLRQAMRDGSYRAILERYGLWNDNQLELTQPAVEELPDKMRSADTGLGAWQVVGNNLALLLRGAGMTIVLSVLSMPLAIVLGLTIALGRLYGPGAVRWPLAVYVEVIRGTPLLLQLFCIHFGVMPMLGLPDAVRAFAPIISSVAGLALNYAAYESEIYRAGLQAIPVGQSEAALALGLTRWQALRFVVIPQAVRLVVPPVTNDFINLFKDTSICSVIAVQELSKRFNSASNAAPPAFAELAIVTALLYLLMSYPLSVFARRLENRPMRSVR